MRVPWQGPIRQGRRSRGFAGAPTRPVATRITHDHPEPPTSGSADRGDRSVMRAPLTDGRAESVNAMREAITDLNGGCALGCGHAEGCIQQTRRRGPGRAPVFQSTQPAVGDEGRGVLSDALTEVRIGRHQEVGPMALLLENGAAAAAEGAQNVHAAPCLDEQVPILFWITVAMRTG